MYIIDKIVSFLLIINLLFVHNIVLNYFKCYFKCYFNFLLEEWI